MNHFIVVAFVLLTGCASLPENYVRVSPRLAERGPSNYLIQVLEHSPDSAFYEIRANDDRHWRIPTGVYVPSKLGIDEIPMREGCDVYQVRSNTHQIIGFQENCGGEWISRRMLFIRGDVARLFDIVTAVRSRDGLPDSEPTFWYTWAIDSIRADGVVIEGILFPWNDLRCKLVNVYKAEPVSGGDGGQRPN